MVAKQFWPLACALLALAACGSSGGSPSSTATPAATAAATGPATAQLTESGSTPALTGAVHATGVLCSLPQVQGTVIRVQATSPGDASVAVVLVVTASSVVVTESMGAGQQFKSRQFTGSGVSGYNDTVGVQIESPLTETSAANSSPGTLGTITSIKGSISCGAFAPGSSTVAVTGTSVAGAVGGTPDTVRVTCNQSAANGSSVTITGHVQIGSGTGLFSVSARNGTLAIVISAASGSDFYTVTGQGVATLTSGGAHVEGTAVESGTGRSVHASGDATCGVTNTGP